METLLQDLRYALRVLRKSPGFTAIATGTLAIGIGANAALFSVVHGVLLRPFPFEDPERLVVVWETQVQQGLPQMYAAPPNLADWEAQSRVFAGMAAFDPGPLFLEGDDAEPVRVQGARISASMFEVLGVRPLLGRAFTPEEDRPGADDVAILGHALWRSRFGGDPEVVGRTLMIDERRRTVVGVMPPGFQFPPPIDLEGSNPYRRSEAWLPLATDLAGGQRGAHYLTVIARLATGVTQAEAESEMVTIAARLEEEHPRSNTGWSVTLVSLEEQVLGDFRPALMVLLGAVGFVLLIACVNVANLLLARGASRTRECAIRAALGAGRARLIRQLLTESLVLAALGGAAGLGLAYWCVDLLLVLMPANVPRLDGVRIDGTVVAFTATVSLVTGTLFGLLPGFWASTLDLNRYLKEGGRSPSRGLARAGLRAGLVVTEVALSLVLLVGAGLLFRSFFHLQGIDPGFRADQVITLRMTLPKVKYAERSAWAARYGQIETEVAAMAGVEAAGFILDIPLGADRQGTSFLIEGEPEPDASANRQINFSFVTPGYFRAMGIPVARGRGLTERDRADVTEVMVINETFARRFLPGRDPLGVRLLVGFSGPTPRRVVGIVGDVRHDVLSREPSPMVYVPYAQVPWSRAMSLVVRTAGEPRQILSSLQARLRTLEPSAPIYEVQTMSQVVADSVANPRFSLILLAAFAGVALLLAAVGIYGVISCSVNQGIHEVGVRMALGARPRDVFRLVVGKGLGLAGIGVGVGTVGAFVLTRFLQSLLFGVSATDPATFASIAAVLMGAAGLACYVPARRAARVEPMVVLRYE